jgi:hypothetical protein
LSEEPYKTIKKVAGPLLLTEKQGKGDRWMKLATGHEIYFRSADNPDRLRSYNLGWFWMDEAAQLPDDEAFGQLPGVERATNWQKARTRIAELNGRVEQLAQLEAQKPIFEKIEEMGGFKR